MIKLLKTGDGNILSENINKQLELQYVQTTKILDIIRDLNQKIDKNYTLLIDLQKKFKKLKEDGSKIVPLKTKNKQAIRLILKRRGKLTSKQLSKIIGLSRTRCSEYLRDLEKEKIVTKETINRRKFYILAR